MLSPMQTDARSRPLVCRLAAATLVGVLAAPGWATQPSDASYLSELQSWRQRADAGLRRERGWLSIVGRWELSEGETTIGAGPGNDVVLPKRLAPQALGTIHVRDGKARLVLAPGQAMRVVVKNEPGAEFTERELLAGDERIEWVTAGRLSLQVVKRDDGGFVLRAADRDAPIRKNFAGRKWYDAKPDYRVPARFVPQPEGTQIPIANVRGEISYENVAGYLEFPLNGNTVRLDALDDDGNLFVIFRDATSAKTTYPAGRFLYIAKPSDGAWTVDFNKAYNPPCAFSKYTTCPLPPPQNWMEASVPAGERYQYKP
jgi:uncharacterized protein (DUF1684 family)